MRNHNKCSKCKNYEIVHSKILNRPVPACNLPKEAKGKCVFVRKEKGNEQ